MTNKIYLDSGPPPEAGRYVADAKGKLRLTTSWYLPSGGIVEVYDVHFDEDLGPECISFRATGSSLITEDGVEFPLLSSGGYRVEDMN